MRNAQRVAGALGIVALVLATGAVAELLGTQPGTSSNPKDNVPKEIQRSDPSGVPFGPGGTGPGTRGNALTGGMVKEKPEPVTRRELERSAENGGGAALAAEDLKEKSLNKSKKGMKSKHRGTIGASATGNDGPKADPKMFQQQRSDNTVQGQQLINEQVLEKQQAASRPGSERGGSQK